MRETRNMEGRKKMKETIEGEKPRRWKEEENEGSKKEGKWMEGRKE